VTGVLEFWGFGVLGFGVLAFWRFFRKISNLKNLKTSKPQNFKTSKLSKLFGGWIARPQDRRDGQDPVAPAQFYDVAGVLALWDVAGQEAVSEAADFVLIEVPDSIA
jgi:hypothetical protein